MKHVIPLESQVITDATDTQALIDRMDDTLMQDHINYAEQERQITKEIGVLSKMTNEMGWSKEGNFKRIAAGIPMPIIAAIRRVDPEFGNGTGIGRAKFYRWLENHPEWSLRGKVGA